MPELATATAARPWRVYVLACSDGSLYVGCTNRLEKRIAAQSRGVGSKYVRSRRPVKLVATGPEMSKSDALKLEARLQASERADKLDWVAKHAIASVRKAVAVDV